MPALMTLLAFSGATILPGPNLLFILGTGISGGRRTPGATAVGVEVGYLIYLGIKALRTRPAEHAEQAVEPRSTLTAIYAVGSGSLGRWLKSRPGLERRQERIAGLIYLCLAALAAIQGTRTSTTT